MSKKTKRIHIKVSEEHHKNVKEKSKDKGMTITGMIRYALKKVFGIDI